MPAATAASFEAFIERRKKKGKKSGKGGREDSDSDLSDD